MTPPTPRRPVPSRSMEEGSGVCATAMSEITIVSAMDPPSVSARKYVPSTNVGLEVGPPEELITIKQTISSKVGGAIKRFHAQAGLDSKN